MLKQLPQMAVFAAVVEQGSFTKAAHHLNISKSVVSNYLSELEKRLDTQLLRRTTRRQSLTDAGERFYERCRDILNQAELATDIAQQASEPSGIVSITAPIEYTNKVLLPLLLEFQQHFPKVQLDLIHNDNLLCLVEQGIDIAVRIGVFHDNGLVCRKLGNLPSRLVASPRYLDEFGTPHNLAQLQTCSGIRDAHSHQYGHIKIKDRFGQLFDLVLPAGHSSNNLQGITQMAVAGLGVAHLPEYMIQSEINQGLLISLLEDHTIAPTPLQLIYPPHKALSPKITNLERFLLERL